MIIAGAYPGTPPPSFVGACVEEQYLKLFFNLMYYLALVPFNVDKDRKTGAYILTSRKSQKIFCAVTTFLSGLLTLLYFHTNYIYLFHLSTDISKLLSATGNIACSFLMVLAIKIVWFNQQNILKLLKASKVVHQGSRQKGALTVKNFVYCLSAILLYFMHITFFLWLDVTLFKPIHLISNGIFLYVPESWNLTRTGTNIFTKFVSYLLAHSSAIRYMVRLFLIALSIQLKAFVRHFEKLMLSDKIRLHSSIEEVMDELNRVRLVLEGINSWAGGLLICTCICVLSYTANVPSILRDDTESSVGRIYPLMYTVMLTVFLVNACDIPQRIRKCFKKWIFYKQSKVAELSQEDRYLLMAFAQEMDNGEPIGLSCTYFTLTYGFLGSVSDF